MKANVYIDGFNLYYGIKKWPQYKWLDFECVASRLFPNDEINRIRYFTADVKGRVDPKSPIRQQAFLRAMKTNTKLEIHKGFFLAHEVPMHLVDVRSGDNPWVVVWKTEEKGSDVNLATYLLIDAINKDCEKAIVISNDSDLREPIRLVQVPPFDIEVSVVNPFQKPRTNMGASHHIDMNVADLRPCQMPDEVVLANKKRVTRPKEWNKP